MGKCPQWWVWLKDRQERLYFFCHFSVRSNDLKIQIVNLFQNAGGKTFTITNGGIEDKADSEGGGSVGAALTRLTLS